MLEKCKELFINYLFIYYLFINYYLLKNYSFSFLFFNLFHQPKPATTPTLTRPQGQPSPSIVVQQPSAVYGQTMFQMYPLTPVSPGVQVSSKIVPTLVCFLHGSSHLSSNVSADICFSFLVCAKILGVLFIPHISIHLFYSSVCQLDLQNICMLPNT